MKRLFGFLLVLIAVGVVISTFYPLAKNEIDYQVMRLQTSPKEPLVPVDTEFGIVIEKLGINTKVVKDVDPYNPNIYQNALTKGVAHAKGTALPGEDGNTFIFSHSSEDFYNALRYNSIFYLLTKLEPGDKISLYYKETRYDYQVSSKQIVDPENTSFLTEDSDKAQLTLMTCYPPGTSLKRLIIVAN